MKKILFLSLLLVQAVAGQAQTAQKAPQPAPNNNVQLKYEGAPQGNTLADQIARAEYFKAQYPDSPATQAKYQAAIDALKKQLPPAEQEVKKD